MDNSGELPTSPTAKKKLMRLFTNKDSLIPIIIVVSVSAVTYYTNLFKGIFHGIALVMIIIPFLLISYLLEYFFKPSKLLKYINVVLLITPAFLFFMLHRQMWSPPPDSVFINIFDTDKPKTITDLKAYAEYPGMDVILRLKFKVNKVDFDNIIKRIKLNKFDKSKIIDFSDDYLISDQLDVFYLIDCKKLSWWDIKHLKSLPQYEWISEYKNPRTLWIEHLDSDVYIIYVSGVGWG